MSSGLALKSNPAPIVACTIARDVQIFDLLIDDLENELGEAWGDLGFAEAATYLGQPEAEELEFVAIAIDSNDEERVDQIASLIRQAKSRGVKVILIAENLTPIILHQLLKEGADDFVPYPLPERALHESLQRIRSAGTPPEAPVNPHVEEGAPLTGQRMDGKSALFAVQSIAGGTGSSTFAVNLAWELANIDKNEAPSVCLIDLDLQFGSASTYLDLPRREVIFEVLSDSQSMDLDSFKQALLSFNQKLSVFTAPTDILPLDIIGPEEIEGLLNLARESFDIVIVDMPTTIVQWTETVLNAADIYFAMLELDMRSAQNTMRFIKALQAESLPLEKVHYVLNRSPKTLDLNGKGRVKRMAESLNIEISTMLPDGTKQVTQACDHGVPLADMARKNPLRKETAKLAKSLYDAMATEAKTG